MCSALPFEPPKCYTVVVCIVGEWVGEQKLVAKRGERERRRKRAERGLPEPLVLSCRVSMAFAFCSMSLYADNMYFTHTVLTPHTSVLAVVSDNCGTHLPTHV